MQFGSPDGFNVPCRATCTIDDSYVDGVSVIHDSPRMHIWTYAAGYIEESPSHELTSTCPCTGLEDLLQILWALTITVSQDLIVLGYPLRSTLMTCCGMDKVVTDLRAHAVISQTSRGSARSFLSQLLMNWRFASVGIQDSVMKISPLTLFNSTYNDL